MMMLPKRTLHVWNKDIDEALRTAIGKCEVRRLTQPDGIHLTAQGNEVAEEEGCDVLLKAMGGDC